MKKIFCLLAFVCFSCLSTAQTNVNADCINAIPLCNTPSFTFFATSGPGTVNDFSTGSNLSNPVNNPFPPNAGCLKSGELNPQWLLLTVGNAGMLEFVFGAGNSPNPQAGCYDWIMWPFNPNTCAGILNNTLPPIRCNWNGDCGSNGTGIASATNIAVIGGSTSNFEPPLAVNACQQFIICISNYSGVNTLVSFQSIGTASLSCNPNCNPNYTMCAGTAATIVPVNYAALSGPTFSIQPGGVTNTTGSFVVNPPTTSSYTTFITGTNMVNAVETITSVSTVTVYPQPSAVPTLTQSTCSNSITTLNLGLTFTPSVPTPSYTIAWSPIPNGILSSEQTTASVFMNGGPYTATVMTANGCSATANFTINPAPAVPEINLTPSGNNFVITCAQPVLTLTALDVANSYTWSNGVIANIIGPEAQLTFTSTGNWTITAVHPVPGCVATKIISVTQSTNFPTSVISPTFQNITCQLSSITTITATASPTVNVSHQIMSPQGGTFTANSHTLVYLPGGVGIYTHCATNDVNGCSTCQTFTVTSSQGFPTYSLVSPENFTLGCSTKSVATINIVGGSSTPPGGPVSYTLIGPTTSPVTPTNILSSQSVYTVNVPGTWTVITKDNTNLCETRTAFSVIQNTFPPDLSVLVPRQVLDCNVKSVKLRGQSQTPNVGYLWSFPGVPGNQPGDTIPVSADFSVRTKSVIANYTLTITDNNNACKSTSVVPMLQNLYLPKVVITNGGISGITCKTRTLTLTNQSSTGIPPGSAFTTFSIVQGFIWDGPTPQEQGQLSSTYLAATPGVYTLTAKDLNNGCTGTGTIMVADEIKYPSVNNPDVPLPSVLDCATGTAAIIPIISNGTSGLIYSWTAPPGAITSSLNLPILTTKMVGLYRVLTTNTVNGCASLVTMTVVNGTLTAGFEPDRNQGFSPLAVTFNNTSHTFTNSSSSTATEHSMTTVWSFGNGTDTVTYSNLISPLKTYFAPGIYKIKIFVHKGNCKDTASRTIVVDLPSSLEIPNVFTPNGDRVNDQFFLKANNLVDLKMVITDRWGNEVYSTTSENSNVSWDGKNLSGKDVAEGVYFYTFKATGTDGQGYDRRGTITLIR